MAGLDVTTVFALVHDVSCFGSNGLDKDVGVCSPVEVLLFFTTNKPPAKLLLDASDSDLSSFLKTFGDAKAPPVGWKPLTPVGFTGEEYCLLVGSGLYFGVKLSVACAFIGFGRQVTSGELAATFDVLIGV